MDTSKTDSKALYYCLPALPDGFEWGYLYKEPYIPHDVWSIWVSGPSKTPKDIVCISMYYQTYIGDGIEKSAIDGVKLPANEALQLIAVNCWLGVIK